MRIEHSGKVTQVQQANLNTANDPRQNNQHFQKNRLAKPVSGEIRAISGEEVLRKITSKIRDEKCLGSYRPGKDYQSIRRKSSLVPHPQVLIQAAQFIQCRHAILFKPFLIGLKFRKQYFATVTDAVIRQRAFVQKLDQGWT